MTEKADIHTVWILPVGIVVFASGPGLGGLGDAGAAVCGNNLCLAGRLHRPPLLLYRLLQCWPQTAKDD